MELQNSEIPIKSIGFRKMGCFLIELLQAKAWSQADLLMGLSNEDGMWDPKLSYHSKAATNGLTDLAQHSKTRDRRMFRPLKLAHGEC
jgi:hypothetical protein